MLARELEITWVGAAAVAVSAVTVCVVLVVLVRVLGQRSLVPMSSFDFGVAVALGAVMGRTALLLDPTLLAGLIAMATLFATQRGLGSIRRWKRVDRLLNRNPVLLMVGRTMLLDAMRRNHVTEDDIRQRLRMAGVTDVSDVLGVVLERNGSVSVLRSGPLSPELLEDVAGGHLLLDPRCRPGQPGAP